MELTDYKILIQQYENQKTILGNILDNNQSDKANNHNYDLVYSFIIEKLGKDSKLNILEIGLGTNNPELVSTMGSGARPGASLYAFREYLPNANIYGCDIDRNILFESERIKTCYVDQLNFQTFDNILNTFGNIKYDLIIDDGLHSIGANLNTLLFALDNLNENGWIVIEDIHILSNWKSILFILDSTKKYKIFVADSRGYLIVINKL